MDDTTIAAYLFFTLTSILMIFQLCLFLGAPWGELAMGGKFPGRYSLKLRIGAFIQMLILGFMGLVVLSRAELVLSDCYELSKTLIWYVVALTVMTAILNTITPSRKERLLWSPVTIVMVICIVIVARG